MSIYWNHFYITIENQTKSDLTWTGIEPGTLVGTLQSAQNVPQGKSVTNACAVQSSSDSTSGAGGLATWGTIDNVTLGVQFMAPNTGDPSGVPSLSGTNKGNYKVTATLSGCSGSGCPINSGYRDWTLSLVLTKP